MINKCFPLSKSGVSYRLLTAIFLCSRFLASGSHVFDLIACRVERRQRHYRHRFEILILAVQSDKCLSVYPGVMSPALCNMADHCMFLSGFRSRAAHGTTYSLTMRVMKHHCVLATRFNARLRRCLKLELGPNGSPNNKQPCTPFIREFRCHQRRLDGPYAIAPQRDADANQGERSQ